MVVLYRLAAFAIFRASRRSGLRPVSGERQKTSIEVVLRLMLTDEIAKVPGRASAILCNPVCDCEDVGHGRVGTTRRDPHPGAVDLAYLHSLRERFCGGSLPPLR